VDYTSRTQKAATTAKIIKSVRQLETSFNVHNNYL